MEVHHPLASDPGVRASGARVIGDNGEAPRGASAASSFGADGRNSHGSEERAQRGPGGSDAPRASGGRRFVLGERVVINSRLPAGNTQDHAFCFECGVFFQLSPGRTPTCTACGGSFIQFLRAAGDQQWVTADGATGGQFAFDDQLDTSITASLDEAPIIKKPTQGAFLRSLPSLQITEADQKERANLGSSDPRYDCAICREVFVVGDTLKRLPCSHEFHTACVTTWLKSQNTCPVCRSSMPEAAEGEEEDQDETVRIKQGGPPPTVQVDSQHQSVDSGVIRVRERPGNSGDVTPLDAVTPG